MPHISRDGVKLQYDDAGSGEPAMVFVHGWCCDRTHFAAQVAHFSARHRCVSLDLRGHGESDVPAEGYSIPQFADDVAALCDELSLRKPVVVGHSMGGAVALSLAARRPDLASAIVMLDGAILQPDALAAQIEQLTPGLHSDAFPSVISALVELMFLPTDEEAVHTRFASGMLKTPRHVAVAAWDALWSNDAAADGAACGVPALYVGAQNPAADMTRVRKTIPHVVLAQTAGAGHFHQAIVPDQVNAMIERFLQVSFR